MEEERDVLIQGIFPFSISHFPFFIFIDWGELVVLFVFTSCDSFRVISWIVVLVRPKRIHEVTRNYTKNHRATSV